MTNAAADQIFCKD